MAESDEMKISGSIFFLLYPLFLIDWFLVLSTLPHLLKLYRTSLAANSSTLFPLPARTSFPTASAARSASEIFELSKQRSLVGGWVRGVCSLIEWTRVENGNGETAKCLWRTFEEIEKGDLYRDGRGEGWEGILESIVEGAVARLQKEGPERFNSMGLLATTMRLSFEAIEPALPAILLSLASTSTTSLTSSQFLTALLVHHSRSLLLPKLLNLLSDAQASSASTPNNLLDSFSWKAELGQALSSLVGGSVASAWTKMVEKITERVDIEMDLEDTVKVKPIERTTLEQESIAARIRMLTLLIRSLPSPIPLDRFNAFLVEQVNPALASLFAGSETIIGISMLEARYAMIDRLRLEGLVETEEWKFDSFVTGALEFIKSGTGSGVIEVVSLPLLESRQLTEMFRRLDRFYNRFLSLLQ